MNKNWKLSEITFLTENYPILGLHYCVNQLKRSAISVGGMVQRLHLHKINAAKYSQIQNIDTPQSVYILGLLWADGCYNKYYVGLSTSVNDTKEITHIIAQTGEWKKYYRKGRLRNNKIFQDSVDYKIHSKDLAKWFVLIDFDKKSTIAPLKLLKQIPKKYLHYFYLGLIDGDGCFYHSADGYRHQFSIASTINQDWGHMIQLCQMLNIKKYSILRQMIYNNKTKKENKYSMFRITNKKDINTLGKFIYKSYYINNIGLSRKFLKYQEIIQ